MYFLSNVASFAEVSGKALFSVGKSFYNDLLSNISTRALVGGMMATTGAVYGMVSDKKKAMFSKKMAGIFTSKNPAKKHLKKPANS